LSTDSVYAGVFGESWHNRLVREENPWRGIIGDKTKREVWDGQKT